MPHRESLKNPICICCQTNRCPNQRQLLCKNCYKFIHDELKLSSSTISHKLGNSVYTKIKHKCDFCDRKAIISYKDYNSTKKWYICKYHRDRWLKIGCQLGQLSNFLHVDE